MRFAVQFSFFTSFHVYIYFCDLFRWFVKSVHGEFFSKSKFEKFLRMRAAPGSGVTFAEIEVMLCNIPSKGDLRLEEEEEKKEREGRF